MSQNDQPTTENPLLDLSGLPRFAEISAGQVEEALDAALATSRAKIAAIETQCPTASWASVASELLLTGDFIGAERAEKVGLVSQVVPEADLENAARDLAGRMLRNSPLGLRLTKECLRHSLDAGSLEQVVAMEDRNQILAARSPHFREGVAAFLEKRAPNYERPE